MQKFNLDKTEIGYKLQSHSYNLSILIQSLDLFKYCLEEELYVNTKVELFSFAKLIFAYVKQMKKDFNEIEKELNIL